MSEFKRENRYLVLKYSDLRPEELEALRAFIETNDLRSRKAVVIEHDWPIYEQTWDAVQRLAEGRVQELDELRANAQERERLKMELSSALNYDASNPSMCDLVVEAQLLKQERDAALHRITELEQAERLQVQLREKIQGERDALATLTQWRPIEHADRTTQRQADSRDLEAPPRTT
ncbi:hypothetical protein HW452_05365 [Halomonas aquamarina]|uniref:Uncharacterized protein n=1 Tax=Vreelandella aquamarina TaxID=77097 RepID=A0ACC5VT72_9GAMM|nr:hypothetical protein [Halomonas aquamarina]MBZ5486951.1 hypothetical protein [Halomonas aquamarina]